MNKRIVLTLLWLLTGPFALTPNGAVPVATAAGQAADELGGLPGSPAATIHSADPSGETASMDSEENRGNGQVSKSEIPDKVAPAEMPDSEVRSQGEAGGARSVSARAEVQSVRLRIDGNLAGLVAMLDPDGKVVPARARVSLIKDGKPIQSVRSEETGAFQMLGVEPGLYSIVAVGQGGFAALTIRIVAFDDSYTPSVDLIKLTLVPSDDYQPGENAEGVAPENIPFSLAPEMAAPMYGGGGSGGLGALAALAALAGIGGGGGGFGGGGGGPVSPNTP